MKSLPSFAYDPFAYFNASQLRAAWAFYRKAPRRNRQARAMALCALRKLRSLHTIVVLN